MPTLYAFSPQIRVANGETHNDRIMIKAEEITVVIIHRTGIMNSMNKKMTIVKIVADNVK